MLKLRPSWLAQKLLMLTDDAYGQPCIASEDQAQIILGYEIYVIERDSKKNN